MKKINNYEKRKIAYGRAIIFIPHVIILASWFSDNFFGYLLRFYIDSSEFNTSKYLFELWYYYEIISKIVLYSDSGFLFVANRIKLNKSRFYHLYFSLIFFMLSFEIIARFFGLLNWMGADYLRYTLFDIPIYVGSSVEIVRNNLEWSSRPFIIFIISASLHFAIIKMRSYYFKGRGW